MHHKVRRGEERSEIGRCAKGKGDASARKPFRRCGERARLGAVVDGDARPVTCCECSDRLPCSSGAENDDRRIAKAAAFNGARLEICERESDAHGYTPTPRVARKVTMPRMPPIAPITQKRKVICVSAQPSRSK